jgi:hypothetical protein
MYGVLPPIDPDRPAMGVRSDPLPPPQITPVDALIASITKRSEDATREKRRLAADLDRVRKERDRYKAALDWLSLADDPLGFRDSMSRTIEVRKTTDGYTAEVGGREPVLGRRVKLSVATTFVAERSERAHTPIALRVIEEFRSQAEPRRGPQ